jgi:methyltransferase, FkbM family
VQKLSDRTVNKLESDRIKSAASCRDAEEIPKIQDAGMVFYNTTGEAIQLMHNGVKVIADGYYGHFNSEIVKKLRGHHEPQQERVFYEVLKLVTAGVVMIELGAYWSYYSLWFHQSVPNAINFVVEPIAENLELGKRNFALNDSQAHFVHALVGDTQSRESEPPTITVDQLAKKEGLTKIEILHADIQGNEYAMLLGTKDLLKSKLVRFVFLSTHGFKIHAKCLGFLRKRRYKIIAEHTPGESYSVDGLIVACADWNIDKIKVTKKPQGIRDRTKSLACRYLSYIVG